MVKRETQKTGIAALLAVAGLLASGSDAAEEVNMYDGEWHYGATIYGWFPDIYTTLNFPRLGDPEVEVRPSSYLHDLQFAAMFAGQARKGDWAIVTDLVYTDLSSLSSKVKRVQGPGGEVELPVTATVNAGLRTTIWTLAASYTTIRNPSGTLDLMGGFRYANFDVSSNWNLAGPIGILSPSGTVSKTVNLWDGIIGAHGAVKLSDDGKWYMPYEADIGWGNNNWTWNAVLGLGYKFDWGDVLFAYRNLSYDQTAGQPIQNMRMTGPALGVSFRW
ncbi:MAG TPA: hypothetical protein VEN29_19095 [Casimicrobiaceae bacterium]|nr:hypothetical protein [Casimicrobiaceae bacterium]